MREHLPSCFFSSVQSEMTVPFPSGAPNDLSLTEHLQALRPTTLSQGPPGAEASPHRGHAAWCSNSKTRGASLSAAVADSSHLQAGLASAEEEDVALTLANGGTPGSLG